MRNHCLTDKEMLQLCLELEKGRCQSISNTMLGTTHPALREVYQECFENSSSNQYQLLDLLVAGDQYKTQIASIEKIGTVQELMQNRLNFDDLF
ncbi:Coat F domain-containing protein [Mesobacillus persicus]|uniref:Coat F domain-containing protein n=1 Tax=Mesobacillus persicus TaxID=930146 RepID=A0A1H7W4L3_9BACI|nr:spore coat protein [Mesobacillus persicus]SEM16049.1 Coat F domain-containing protein [Mesobacillus persicus]